MMPIADHTVCYRWADKNLSGSSKSAANLGAKLL